MLQIKVQLDNDDHYVGSNKPEYIVIHGTGNYDDTDEGNVKYFCSGTRNSSAHYFVDGDSITQLVLDRDGAWHCGDGHNKYGINNNNSIGIEMCNTKGDISEATILNTLELVRLKMSQYNIPLEKVVRHYDASRKNCPAPFSPDNWARWNMFKYRIKNTAVNGWLFMNGEWYFMEYNTPVTNCWKQDAYGDWYFLMANGRMARNFWATDSSLRWFYLGDDGKMKKDFWVHWTDGKQYYVGYDGAMLVNCITPDGWRVGNDGAWDGGAQCQ